jgi:uncharacterized protein YqhQ
LWLQSLTTREPDDNQIEVAIVALKEVITSEQTEVGLTENGKIKPVS